LPTSFDFGETMTTTEQVYRFIRGYKLRYCISPSFREIMEACKLSSTSVVKYHMDKLRRTGQIEFGREARSIHIPGEKMTIQEV